MSKLNQALTKALWDGEISKQIIETINLSLRSCADEGEQEEYLLSTFVDKDLYNKAKDYVKSTYSVWPSAYASAALVKKYKSLGGKIRATTNAEEDAEGLDVLIQYGPPKFLPEVETFQVGSTQVAHFYQGAPEYASSAVEDIAPVAPAMITDSNGDPSDRYGGVTKVVERIDWAGEENLLSLHPGGLKDWFEGETPPEDIRKKIGGVKKDGGAKWSGGWVRVSGETGEILGPCGDKDDKESYPKCMSYQRWKSLNSSERKDAVKRKQEADNPKSGKGKTPVYIKTEKASMEAAGDLTDAIAVEEEKLSDKAGEKPISQRTNFPNRGDDKEVSLSNSQWEVFPLDYAKDLEKNWPKIWAKGGNIRGNSQYKKLVPVKERGGKVTSDTEREAVKLREAWVARHEGDFQLAGVIAQIKWLAVGKQGVAKMKAVVEEAKDKEKKKQHLSSTIQLCLPGELEDYLYDLRYDLSEIVYNGVPKEEVVQLVETLRKLIDQDIPEEDLEALLDILHEYVDASILAKTEMPSVSGDILDELSEIADFAHGDEEAQLFSYSVDVMGLPLIKSPKEEYSQLKAADRNALPDSAFGIPEDRRFPINDAVHVRKAAQLISKAKNVSPEKLTRLKGRIRNAAKKYGVKVPSLDE